MSVNDLPDDPKLLKRLLAERDVTIARLQVELLRLRKWYYGKKADTLTQPDDVAQLLLAFAEELESRPLDPDDLDALRDSEQPDELREVEPATARRVRRGRRDLEQFDHLPTVRREHDLSEEQKPCPCCGERREQIGQERSWQIEYIPGRFERIEHVRLKYACRRCEQNAEHPQIELAEKPAQPIEKGLAGPGLLAFMVTAKFSDYLPLYRLEDLFTATALR